MRKRIGDILGTVKTDKESWPDLFRRLDIDGRLDSKSVSMVLAILLDELEQPKEPVKDYGEDIHELAVIVGELKYNVSKLAERPVSQKPITNAKKSKTKKTR